METDFYRLLRKNHTEFTTNIFINLTKFRNRAFKGRSYRGVKLAHFDVIPWRWAAKKADRLIEMHTFVSTSELESIATKFASNPSRHNASALFIFDFSQICDTAIKLNEDKEKGIKENLSDWPDEQEILITPYTLFQVKNVEFDRSIQLYRIHLIHVPIMT